MSIKIERNGFVEKYESIEVKAKATCYYCNHFIAVNKFTNKINCTLCGNTSSLDNNFWKNAISNSKLTLPICNSCKSRFDIDTLLNAVETGNLICPTCNNATSIKISNTKIRSINTHLLHFDFSKNEKLQFHGKDVVAIIGENAQQKLKKNKSINVVDIECNNCGAPLKVKDNSEYIICDYCGTNNMIQQKTNYIHVDKVIPFYILFLIDKWNIEERKRKEDEQQRKAEENKQKQEEIRNKQKEWRNEQEKIKENRRLEEKNRSLKEEKRIKLNQKKNSFIFFSIAGIITTSIILLKFFTDIIEYKEKIEIEDTNYSIIQSHHKNNLWGVIDNNTEQINIPIEYEEINYLFNNYFKVRKTKEENTYTVINTENKIIIPKLCNNITYLTNENDDVFGSGYFLLYIDHKYLGLFNNKYEKVISNEYNPINTLGDYIIIRNNGKLGLADTLGNIVLPIKYYTINSIEDGYVKVYGKKGTTVVKLIITEQDRTKEAKRKVKEETVKKEIKKKKKENKATKELNRIIFRDKKYPYLYGLKDGNGNIIVKPIYNYIDKFYNDIAIIQNKKGYYGFINRDGKVIVSPMYQEINNFTKPKTIVKSNNKYGIIDTKGEIIIPIEFTLSEIKRKLN